MKKEACEKAIIESMTGIIKVNHDDEKNDKDFSGQDFQNEQHSDGKVHFFQHSNAWIDFCCDGMDFETQSKYYTKLFSEAWNTFARNLNQ